jgi:hypothetical protein
LSVDLVTNRTYLVVLRYLVDAASTTLWVNPANENASGITATDSYTGAAVSSFGFRQDADIGATMLIDDLKVGLSFAAVTGAGGVTPIPIQIRMLGGSAVLTWSSTAFTLQSAPSVTGSFTNVPGATSPYTNAPSGPTRFFRLKAN